MNNSRLAEEKYTHEQNSNKVDVCGWRRQRSGELLKRGNSITDVPKAWNFEWQLQPDHALLSFWSHLMTRRIELCTLYPSPGETRQTPRGTTAPKWLMVLLNNRNAVHATSL